MKGRYSIKCMVGLLVFLIVVVFLAIPYAQCGTPNYILFGATVSKSGKFSSEIGPFDKLMDTWAKMINERGGIYVKEYKKRIPVKFVTYDDKSDEATAKKFYERLITVDKVNLLFGPYSSPLTFASSTASENHHVPFIAICANSPKIYSRGFKWTVGVIDLGGRYTYRYWEMLGAEKKAKTVSFVVEDTLHPIGVYKGSVKLAKKAGLKVLSADTIPYNAKDFTPVITKLKNLNPDIVFVSCNIPFGVAFMKQAKELNLNPREFHVIHHSGVFRKPLGKDADFVVGNTYWTPEMNYDNPQFLIDLLKRSGISESDYPWAPAYMMAFQIAEQAIERAGTLKNDRLMKILKDLNVMTVGGPDYFHPTGYGAINTYPSQIQKGKYVVIWPPDVATGKHIYPTPPWDKR